MAKKQKKLGRLSIDEMRNLINKKAGMQVGFDLSKENPTDVTEWIPTGSRWLDSVICRGQLAGIPTGKVVEIAGLEGSGKSFMAAQIAANAQKMGIDVVYFEWLLETIEELLGSNENRMLFIWDSLALTPSISDVEGDFNPQSSMAVKPRILAKGMSKLTVPIAASKSTFLVLNQLKTNITSNIAEAMTTPYVTPGGKAMHYAYSLRIWLTKRKAKASYIIDDNGFRVGSEVKVTLKKSRFGTEGRQCTFKILWGGEVGIQDEESWFEAVKGSDNLKQAGAWYNLIHEDGSSEKFQASKWREKLQSEKFRNRILQIMDEEVIMRFEKKQGQANDFYDIDQEQQSA